MQGERNRDCPVLARVINDKGIIAGPMPQLGAGEDLASLECQGPRCWWRHDWPTSGELTVGSFAPILAVTAAAAFPSNARSLRQECIGPLSRGVTFCEERCPPRILVRPLHQTARQLDREPSHSEQAIERRTSEVTSELRHRV